MRGARTIERALVPLAAALFATSAGAATIDYYVNSTDDAPAAGTAGFCETAPGDGVCTLRAAVMAAQVILRQSGEEAIIHVPAGTYTLTIPPSGSFDTLGRKGNLYVAGLTTIVGAGPGATIIDANHIDRAMWINTATKVKLSGLTIRNGQPSTAIHSFLQGGGIFVQNGDVSIDHSVIEMCSSPGSPAGTAGGGIHFNYLGTFSISWSTIRYNTTDGSGGGIQNNVGELQLDHVSIHHNQSANSGGGILTGSGNFYASNSTIGWNSASQSGGGICIFGGATRLSNMTIAVNTVGLGDNPNGDGGGIFYEQHSQTLFLFNSILRSNSNEYSRTPTDCSGPITTNGHDIITEPGDTCVVGGGFSQADPLLGVLQDNGGGSFTFMPAGAAAIDGGDHFGCQSPYEFAPNLTDDQRGVKRPIGAYCDLGAVEVEQIGDVNGDGVRDVADVFYLINFLFAGGDVPKGRANVNGDQTIDVADVFYLVNFLFAGGPPPQ